MIRIAAACSELLRRKSESRLARRLFHDFSCRSRKEKPRRSGVFLTTINRTNADQISERCVFSLSFPAYSRFSREIYAFADAATIPGAVHTPFPMRPAVERRTVTAP